MEHPFVLSWLRTLVTECTFSKYHFSLLWHSLLKGYQLCITCYYCRVLSGRGLVVGSGPPDGEFGCSFSEALFPFWSDGLETSLLDSLREGTPRVWQRQWPNNVWKATMTWSCELLSCMTSWTWCQRVSSKTRLEWSYSIWVKRGDAGRPIFPGR